MKKLAPLLAGILGTLIIALAFNAQPAHAQYAPPLLPNDSQSTVGFWAAGKTSLVSATGTSARIALSVTGVKQVQVYNAATTAAFVAFGDITITASAGSAGTSTSDYVIAPGAVIVLTVPQVGGVVYAAVVLASSTGLVYLTPGLGL